MKLLIALMIPVASLAAPLPDMTSLIVEQLVLEHRVEKGLNPQKASKTCIAKVCDHWETNGCDEFYKLNLVAESCADDNLAAKN